MKEYWKTKGARHRAKGNVDGSPGCPVSISVPTISRLGLRPRRDVLVRPHWFTTLGALYLPTLPATHHHSHYPLTVTELSWDRTLRRCGPFVRFRRGRGNSRCQPCTAQSYLRNLSCRRGDVVRRAIMDDVAPHGIERYQYVYIRERPKRVSFSPPPHPRWDKMVRLNPTRAANYRSATSVRSIARKHSLVSLVVIIGYDR